MKRILAMILACILVLGLTACSGEVPSYSEGLASNGYYEGITATDYVTLGNYKEFVFDAKDLEVTEKDVQADIDYIISSFTTTEKVTDTVIKDGDTVNIDYVGYIDGVAFETGTTNGKGTDVTIGVTNYIDDFLEQLIGHKPGDKFDVEVTFPESYKDKEVAGKDATFSVTINHVVVSHVPEFNDEFVKENLTGFETVEDYKEYVREYLYKGKLQSLVYEELMETTTIEKYPEEIVERTKKSLEEYYQSYAEAYEMELDEYLAVIGVTDLEAEAKLEVFSWLTLQAVCEVEGLKVEDNFIDEYFGAYADTYISQYGKPYVCQYLLPYIVVEHLDQFATVK